MGGEKAAEKGGGGKGRGNKYEDGNIPGVDVEKELSKEPGGTDRTEKAESDAS